MEEEGISFTAGKGVFYNPSMRFCRSMSSLAVGAIGEEIEVVDAFCASGIRGIRYAKENRNVKKLTSLDIEKKAISLAKKNAKANKIGKSAKNKQPFVSVCANISRAAFGLDADFLEIDPFGTPSPYLVDAFRFFNTKKAAFLSVTATDVAVLCGGKLGPCLKNYHSVPMNNEFTHETGLRILVKRIAEVAAEFNMGISPLVSFSDRHYLKSVLSVKRSADLAEKSMKSLGHVSYCKKCGWRGSGKFPMPCANCAETGNPKPETLFAGPLWLSELHDAAFLAAMRTLNEKRGYADRDEIARMLSLMEGECGMPPYHYDVHRMCRTLGTGGVPKMENAMKSISDAGYEVRRTHFSPVSLKTDAPYGTVAEAMRWKS
ncbi:MAG: tRNA (guanine(10)-N(2))-dimethyltransferase [Candidatus Micrarchaeota archaeon]